MADGFEMLAEDHRAIERELDTVRHDEEGSMLRDLCERITRHSQLEDAALYPALRRYVDGGDDLADHAEQEHATTATMIAELYDSATPERLPDLVNQLRRVIMTHFEEEEAEIFPAMRSCGVDGEQLAATLDQSDPRTPRAS